MIDYVQNNRVNRASSEKYAHKKRYGYRWQQRRAAHLRKEPFCRICKLRGRLVFGTKERPLHVDHIIPVDRGGTDDESNLQTLCIDCHNQKTAAERAGKPWRIKGCDVTGAPLDPNHPWFGDKK